MKALEAIKILRERLKNVDASTDTAELEELAEDIDALTELETVGDVLSFGAEKISEISNLADKTNAAIDASVEARPAELSAAKENSLSSVLNEQTIGEENIAQNIAEKSKEINDVVDNFSTLNDVPENSAIRAEISPRLEQKCFLKTGALPFVFGVLSRYNDFGGYGVGQFSSDFYGPGSGAMPPDSVFQLLVGAHDYTTERAGFYKPPTLCFLQGEGGNFIFRELYTTYQYGDNGIVYARMPVGALFVKNTTNASITRTLYFGGVGYVRVYNTTSGRTVVTNYDATYGGLALYVGVPAENAPSWSTAYYVSGSAVTGDINASASVTIPANATAVILLCSTSRYLTYADTCYFQFSHWYLRSVRSAFLGSGLEIDIEKTMKAWQCPGFENTRGLWG
jgi:hypothetical protein